MLTVYTWSFKEDLLVSDCDLKTVNAFKLKNNSYFTVLVNWSPVLQNISLNI